MSKTTHIEYGESIQTGFDTWKRINIKIELEEGDDIEQEQEKLIKRVSDRSAKFVEIVDTPKSKLPFTKKPLFSHDEQLIQAINNCNEIDGENGLSSYRLAASLNPSAKSAYDLKMLELKK